jgi:hypothetical protein
MATPRERADEPRRGAIEHTTLVVEVVPPAAVTSLRPASEARRDHANASRQENLHFQGRSV